MVIEGVCESKEASDGAVGEKKVKFCENSVLVAPLVLIFAFFSISGKRKSMGCSCVNWRAHFSMLGHPGIRLCVQNCRRS